VKKAYAFEGPKGKASLLDLFEGRRQLIVYRAFFEPGVYGWPEPPGQRSLASPRSAAERHATIRIDSTWLKDQDL
jgi:predicted dithiol-disulfide oxidoreductase (DUF899 family)